MKSPGCLVPPSDEMVCHEVLDCKSLTTAYQLMYDRNDSCSCIAELCVMADEKQKFYIATVTIEGYLDCRLRRDFWFPSTSLYGSPLHISHRKSGFPRGIQTSQLLYKGGCSSVNAKPTPQAPTSPSAPHRQDCPNSPWSQTTLLAHDCNLSSRGKAPYAHKEIRSMNPFNIL
jgi:hypothetical protein